jgi:hypothetical protein
MWDQTWTKKGKIWCVKVPYMSVPEALNSVKGIGPFGLKPQNSVAYAGVLRQPAIIAEGLGHHVDCEHDTVTNTKTEPTPLAMRMPVADVLHRGLVTSLFGLTLYGVFMGVAIHRDTLRRGRGE